MSNDTTRKTRRLVRRSIPVLIPKETGRKGTKIITSTSEKTGPTAHGAGDAGGSKTKTKQTVTAEKGNGSSCYREKTDDHPKPRPALSLQGPFNPNIVGHRRTDEPKRKRNPLLRSGNGGEKSSSQAQPLVPKDKVELFSNIKEVEDHKSKRNPTQEKKRCSVEFQHKPDTNFAENTDKAITFTAAGKTAFKLHPKNTRHMESWKSERQLREKLQNLECEKDLLAQDCKKAIDEMEKKLKDQKEEKVRLRSEKLSLEEQLNEKDAVNNDAIEEKTRSLSAQNDSLQERLDTCHRKLEELNVDPVHLTSLPPGSETEMTLRSREAAGQAAALREELSLMKQRNLEIMASLKSEEMKENKPLADEN